MFLKYTPAGIEGLKKMIFKYLPEGPFLYPEEDMSDKPERFFVAELIREKVFGFFKKESQNFYKGFSQYPV